MTSTLGEPQPVEKSAAPPTGDDPAAAAKRRLSCTACAAPSSAAAQQRRPSASSLQASPASSRRSSLQQQKNNIIPAAPAPTPASAESPPAVPCLALQYSSRSSSQDSLASSHQSANPNNVLSLDLSNFPSPSPSASPSSSSSFHAPAGFTLNFNSLHSQPKIKCHIDQLHQDLDLAIKLDGPYDRNNNTHNNTNDKATTSPSSATKLTLDCYNRSDPNKNIKFRVELVKTSPKGFGLRIMQSMPHTGIGEPTNGSSSATKNENPKRGTPQGDSRRSSLRSESSRHTSKTNDISDFDAVRISGGKLSKAEDDGEDNCKCTTPCGVPSCKAEEAQKHAEREIS